MSEAAPWEQQWARVGRWFERFSKTAGGRDHDRESDHYQDDVLGFFLNCYHLKDWLKKDPVSATVAADVERFVADSFPFSICGDLANGAKHLVLDSPRVGAGAKFGRKVFQLELKTRAFPRISATYSVEADGQRHDAFKLAKDCMAEWNSYLQSKGLLT